MDYLEKLEKIIKHNNFATDSIDSVLLNLAAIVQINSDMINGIEGAVNNRFGQASIFVACPTCQTKTLVSFENCHLCGENLFENVSSEAPKEVVEKKVEKPKKEKKVKEEKTIIEELEEDGTEEIVTQDALANDFDDEDDLDDLLADEQPKEEKKTKAKKEVKDELDDDDSFFDDDDIADSLEDDEDDLFDDEDLDL